ncbi:putative ORAOV1 family protein [Hanseniaspora uvarum DSM 2768]|nr:hypothetical protein FOG48_03720 [Hanseniaspora uvarum]KKA02642.1 putative ORAOV1 family protein [Hanseniaspora uvarum DSM 2768]
MNDDLFDEMILLSPEQVNYNLGYKEGEKISERRNIQEGKEYGMMIGYQSFLIIGQVYSIVECLILDETLKINEGMKKSCIEIINLIDNEIKESDNDADIVQKNIDVMSKIKNKLKLIMIMFSKYDKSSSLTYEKIEKVYNKVGNGLIPSSKFNEVEEDKSNLVNGMDTDW